MERGRPPPPSSCDKSNFRREETRGERRGKSAGEEEGKDREQKSPPPLVTHARVRESDNMLH